MAINERRKSLPGGGGPAALPSGERGVERTVRELRVDDVLTIDGKDFLVEGLINYDEDGHRWLGGRVADGADVRWLVIGIERAGSGTLRLLAQDDATQISGYPPEVLVIGELRYALDKRG